jgi:hypothetical protein
MLVNPMNAGKIPEGCQGHDGPDEKPAVDTPIDAASDRDGNGQPKKGPRRTSA